MTSLDSDIPGLWTAFKANGDRKRRDQLILHYSPLVKFVAGRMAIGLPNNVEQADLASYGIFGLMDAIEKFEPERGFKFETYAMSRIKGAILDGLRANDWVPRSVRAKARAIEQAYARLEGTLHHTPSDAELGAELGLDDQQLQSTLSQISLVGVVALDDMFSGGGTGRSTSFRDTLATADAGPGLAYGLQEMRRTLAGLVGAMPEREKIVLTLYYYESLTLAQIGEVLGVTESRISQIHTKAVLQLRARMGHAERESA